jgi:hypothetical protein
MSGPTGERVAVTRPPNAPYRQLAIRLKTCAEREGGIRFQLGTSHRVRSVVTAVRSAMQTNPAAMAMKERSSGI